ncbi:UNKNOWN [Stylonychia lemnae]|uniref:Uncharacterized protein n=1 Tax=Stylonychia lemnae TaxID=5949 RepID=A0A078AG41_STYLE|nr:UNKNOWN [Stylonychia lemnae]|eukprot:CDW81280.1 UNKNOWN [Stylonychia lemnae]
MKSPSVGVLYPRQNVQSQLDNHQPQLLQLNSSNNNTNNINNESQSNNTYLRNISHLQNTSLSQPVVRKHTYKVVKNKPPTPATGTDNNNYTIKQAKFAPQIQQRLSLNRVGTEQQPIRINSKQQIGDIQDQKQYFAMAQNKNINNLDQKGNHKTMFVAKRYSEQAVLQAALEDDSTQVSKQDTNSSSRFKVNSNTIQKHDDNEQNYNNLNSNQKINQQKLHQSSHNLSASKFRVQTNESEEENNYFGRGQSSNKKNQLLQSQVQLLHQNLDSSITLNSRYENKNSLSIQKRHLLGSVEDYLQNFDNKNNQQSIQLSNKDSRQLRIKIPLNKSIKKVLTTSNNNHLEDERSNLLNSGRKAHQDEMISVINTLQQSSKPTKSRAAYQLSNQFSNQDKILSPIIKEIIPMHKDQIQDEIYKIEERLHQNKLKEQTQLNKHQNISQKLAQTKDQRALDQFGKLQSIWNYQKDVAISQVGLGKRESVINQSDDYRVKAEIKAVLEKAQSIQEKYGEARGWRMSLRYNDEVKDDQLEYSESSGPLHQGISYKIKDDRKVPIEIVRRCEMQSPSLQVSEYQEVDIQIFSQKGQRQAALNNSALRSYNHYSTKNQNNASHSLIQGLKYNQGQNRIQQQQQPFRPYSALGTQNSFINNPLIQAKFNNKDKKLKDILPTNQSDSDIKSLLVIGENVLEKEKEAVIRIRQLKNNLQIYKTNSSNAKNRPKTNMDQRQSKTKIFQEGTTQINPQTFDENEDYYYWVKETHLGDNDKDRPSDYEEIIEQNYK